MPATSPAPPGPMLALAGNLPLESPSAVFTTDQPDQWRSYTNGNEVKALAAPDAAGQPWFGTGVGVSELILPALSHENASPGESKASEH